MTHPCCTHCRLRFGGAAGTEAMTCPECDRPVVHHGPSDLLGYPLFRSADPVHDLPAALTAAFARPDDPSR
jgi:hypothetical protein